MDDRPQSDIDAEAYDDARLTKLAAFSAADAAWVEAIRAAGQARTEAGLDCSYAADGSAVFTVEQGLKAACYTREDTAATLIVQREILIRLDQLRKLAWWVIGLLAVIALKLL